MNTNVRQEQPVCATDREIKSAAVRDVHSFRQWLPEQISMQQGTAIREGHEKTEVNPLVAAISNTTAVLLASAHGFGLVVSGDLRVNEKAAAKLLGFSHEHLKSIRQLGNAPVCYAIGVDGGRLSYRLGDLASWIEAGREDLTHR